MGVSNRLDRCTFQQQAGHSAQPSAIHDEIREAVGASNAQEEDRFSVSPEQCHDGCVVVSPQRKRPTSPGVVAFARSFPSFLAFRC